MDISKIKLIIWDLDETFWKGTLSDNTHEIIPSNLKLITDLTDAGVINSICSKNEETEVEKLLKEHNVSDYFVFKSINWSPKGERVKQIITEMQLRSPNVLFIDDNSLNLEEVKNSCPGIMAELPSVVPELIEHFSKIEKKDRAHARLAQYKVLEKKKEFKAQVGSNIEFLKQSNIEVTIKHDVENNMERIEDLILRSNQLNFTKVRSTKSELESLLKDSAVNCGYVHVKDNFGDYGITGFYAVKNNRLLHFVFSCRTLNMGIEQYVYNKLNKPELEIVGEVASNPKEGEYFWINSGTGKTQEKAKVVTNKKIIIKGPCDMSQMFSYVEPDKNIITEFVYVNDAGVSIEQGNHTSHIIQSKTLTNETKQQIIKELPFGDKDMYNTQIFNDDVGVVVLSLFTDPNLGLYRHKKLGAVVAFGEYTNDLTDKNKWQDYIDKKLFVANCNFTTENLTFIQQNYEFIGRLNPNEVLQNVQEIYTSLNPNATLVLVLGSELEHTSNIQPAYEGRHLYNKELNKLIKDFAAKESRIKLIDTNKWIDSEECYTNNINHFVKKIYFEMSNELISIVNENGNSNIASITKFGAFKRNIKTFVSKCFKKIKRILFKQVK